MQILLSIKRYVISFLALALLCSSTVSNAWCYYPKCIRPFFDPCGLIDFPPIWFQGDFLYWGAYEDGLQVKHTLEDNFITPNGAQRAFVANEKNLDFKWSPGFRVSTGYGFVGHPGFGALVAWTNLETTAKRCSGPDLSNHWNISFNMVDALGGVELNLTGDMLLTLYGGVSAVKITQRLRTDFVQIEQEGSSSSEITTEFHQNNHSDFHGVGPKIGLEAEWLLRSCHVSLYGSVGGAVLFGHNRVVLEVDSFSPTFNESRDVTRSLHACQTVFDAGVGVRWNRVWECGWNSMLQLGFEHHQYFNQNRIGCGSGDLYFEGLVAGIRIGF